MQPIKIDFIVGNKGASREIDKVAHSLTGLDEAADKARSSTASLSAETIIINADAQPAIEQATELSKAFDNTASEAKTMSADVRAAVASISGADVQFPEVQTGSSVDNLNIVESEAEQASSAITDADAEFPDITPSADKAAENLERIAREARAAHAAVADEVELLPNLDAETSKAVRHLDIMLEEANQLKAALASSGQIAIFDSNNEARSLRELNERIEQIIDATELLTDKNSNLDYGSKWAQKGSDDITKLIDDYYAAQEAAEESADKQIEALERMQAKTQEQAEAFAHAQLLKEGSLEDLEAALEKYRAELVEANKAEDQIASLKIEKRIAATEQAIKKQTTATERATLADQRRNAEILRGGNIAERIFSEVASAALESAATTTKATGALGFFRRGLAITTAAVRGFSVAVKAALGPIGIALLAFEAASWAASKAWEELAGWWAKGSNAAKEQTEAIKAQSAEIKKLAEEAEKVVQATELLTERSKIEEEFLTSVKSVTKEYEAQSAEIERQLILKKYGLDDEIRTVEYESELAKRNLQLAALEGGWSERRLEMALRGVELDRQRSIATLENQRAQAEATSSIEREENAERSAIQAERRRAQGPFGALDDNQLNVLNGDIDNLNKRAVADSRIFSSYQDSAIQIARLLRETKGESADGVSSEKLAEIIDLLKPIGYSGFDVRSFDAKQLESALTLSQNEYQDRIADFSKAQDKLIDAANQAGINPFDYLGSDGFINFETLGEAIKESLNVAIEASQLVNKAKQELSSAQASSQSAIRSRDILSRQTLRDDAIVKKSIEIEERQYEAEQAAEQKRKEEQRKREKLNALNAVSSDARLRREVSVSRQDNSDFGQQREDLATSQLLSNTEQTFNEFVSDGKLTNEEIKKMGGLIQNLKSIGTTRDTVVLLREITATLESQEIEIQSSNNTIRTLRAQLNMLKKGQLRHLQSS